MTRANGWRACLFARGGSSIITPVTFLATDTDAGITVGQGDEEADG